MTEEFLWVEKYRPKTIADTILSPSLRKVFSDIIKGGEIPNMLLVGSAGVGKTTIAKALCHELNVDYLFVNASEEGKIDMLRTRIRQFASTVSLSGGYKVVILDEADYLTSTTQPALRGFIEEFSANCRFILTANFKNRIIEPIHSRCSVYEFNIKSSERPKIAMAFFNRLRKILDAESVQYDDKTLVSLIEKYFPDWRRILNECQRYGMSGQIDAGILVNLSDENVKVLMGYLRDKDFKAMREWVSNNMDTESSAIFRKLYDNMGSYVESSSIPQLILILAEYQYKDAFVADKEINTVACLTEVMGAIEFK